MKDAPKGAMPIGAPITDGDHTHNRPADLMSDSETTEMNEVAEAYANMRRRRIGRLKIALTEARRVDADEWAEIITLSEEIGLSIDVVELEKDLIKQRLDEQGFLAQFDLEELHDDYPATAEFLSDFYNTRYAHRDIERLKNLEKGLAEGRQLADIDNLNFAEQRFYWFVNSRPDIMARFIGPKPDTMNSLDPTTTTDDDDAFGA